MTEPDLDFDDDDAVELSPLVIAAQRYVKPIALVTLIVVCVTAAVNMIGMHDVLSRRSTQHVRFVFRGAFELINGGQFRIIDVIDKNVLGRVYNAEGLKEFVPFDTFVRQISMVGLFPAKGEYAIWYESHPGSEIPEARMSQVLPKILAEWGRGIIRARGQLSDDTSWAPQPLDLHAHESLLVRADTARRQLKRYTLRLAQIAARPIRVPEPPGYRSLTDVRLRIDDRMRLELEPMLFAICRSGALAPGDRSYLEARLLRNRLDAVEAHALVGVQERAVELAAKAPPAPDRDAQEIARQKLLMAVFDARRQALAIENEVAYYQALIAASSGRAPVDSAALTAKFEDFTKDMAAEGQQADPVARAILGQSATMEGIDYVLGDYTAEVVTRSSPAKVKSRAFLALLATPLFLFPACLGWHFGRQYLRKRTAA